MTNTVATLSAVIKQVFANGVTEAVPVHNYLFKNVPFEKGTKKLGKSYEKPVALTQEWSATFNSDGSAYALNPERNATYGRMSIDACSLTMSGEISYAMIQRSLTDPQAFATGTATVIRNLIDSATNILEHEFIYGQEPLASVSAVAMAGTTGTFVVDLAAWSDAFWSNSIGMAFDIYVTTATATKTNTNAALVVTSVDRSTRTVTFSGSAADAAAVDALTTAVVYFRNIKTGAATYNDCPGLSAITTAATVYGLSTASFPIWKPQTYAVGSTALTMDKIQKGLGITHNNGFSEDTCVLLNPQTWANVNNDLASLRANEKPTDGDVKPRSQYIERESKNGRVIRYYSQYGIIELVSHPFVHEGDAFAFPLNKCVRIGSRDVGFGVPGTERGDDILFHAESAASAVLRMFTDQAFCILRPGTLVKFTGIVNA